MLIIARRVGETIYLGDDVEIRIMDLSPSRVKIGIVAPKQLSILRGEMKQAEEQNRAASQSTTEALPVLVKHLRSHSTDPHR